MIPSTWNRPRVSRPSLHARTAQAHASCDRAPHRGRFLVARHRSGTNCSLYETNAGAGGPTALPPPALEYKDFVRWQAGMLGGPEGERAREYWRSDWPETARVNLPTDRPRPAFQTFRGAGIRFDFGDELTGRLRAFARAEVVTPSWLVLAAFQILLGRYTGQDDIRSVRPRPAGLRPSTNRSSAPSSIPSSFVPTCPVTRPSDLPRPGPADRTGSARASGLPVPPAGGTAQPPGIPALSAISGRVDLGQAASPRGPGGHLTGRPSERDVRIRRGSTWSHSQSNNAGPPST